MSVYSIQFFNDKYMYSVSQKSSPPPKTFCNIFT